ncbi:MAG: LysR family transcriptional regulator [Halobacteriovoraceae bacterium]|nr:LysR family transcriptional regulator [Halobacteriovoraceae bacterium]
MELFELKYFMAVAEVENVNLAASKVHVSAGSLSKAISRLEEELQTALFYRQGRGIKLSPQGLQFKEKAARMLSLAEEIKFEMVGNEAGSLNIYISADEVAQTLMGVKVVEKIEKVSPQARVHFLIRNEKKAIEQLSSGEVQIALITGDVPKGLSSKNLFQSEFVTCASKKHPLYKKYKGKTIPVRELLKHPFVSPDSAIFGSFNHSASMDGWRDDKFPRKIKYKVCGLKLMENLIAEGKALGYLPEALIHSTSLVPLKVSGCPYSCKQTVKIVSKQPEEISWLANLWDHF